MRATVPLHCLATIATYHADIENRGLPRQYVLKPNLRDYTPEQTEINGQLKVGKVINMPLLDAGQKPTAEFKLVHLDWFKANAKDADPKESAGIGYETKNEEAEDAQLSVYRVSQYVYSLHLKHGDAIRHYVVFLAGDWESKG